MAIFGGGSSWGKEELKDDFFKNENYVIGWNFSESEDLYTQISSIKVGDIIYLKSNKPGSSDIRIKGIGIVTNSLIQKLFNENIDLSNKRANFELTVKWLIKSEFKLTIPKGTGKLTNIRAATLYEEFMPYVQNQIINKIIDRLNIK